MGNSSRQSVSTGTVWEEIAGFSRAVRVKQHVYVAGTTATQGGETLAKGDPAQQMHFILQRIEAALNDLGASLNDVVRTRIFVRHIDDWEAITKVHGEYFSKIRPACTLVQAMLVSDCLVEVEAEALICDG